MKTIRNNKGFTLLELVIVLAILGIVTLLITQVVSFSSRFINDEHTSIANQETLRYVGLEFDRSVRRLVENINHDFVVTTSGSTTCYALGSTEIDTYCFNTTSRVLTKNGRTIGTGINEFTPVTISTERAIHLIIRSLPDGRGNVNEVELIIYIRQIDRA